MPVADESPIVKPNPRQEASNEMRECVEKVLHSDARVPVSTYRVQMHKDFTFAQAKAILGYLKKLGIGDFYSSPIFEARPGSVHGYDVTRHDRLNPEIGGDEGFNDFCAELQGLGLGLLLDIVPNHMGVGNDSIWWQDVLENGHASLYSEYFDIDWKPLKPALRNKLLLPILGDQYGAELEAKHIQVAIEDGRPLIHYYDHTMPVAPRTVSLIFDSLGDHGGEAIPDSLREVMARIQEMPPHETSDDHLRDERRAQLAELLPRLRELLRSPEMQPFIKQALAAINGVEGDPKSFDQLHRLLDAQPYRLASWRTSAEEINYRRFFDVNDLVGLRMENPAVFRETHCLIRSLLASHKLTGLRIDHCDGMFNPRQYLIRLQLLYLASQCAGPEPRQETASNGIERSILDPVRGYDWPHSQGALYTVVEKILEPHEYLPPEWPVRGTSGYDFVYLANGIFIRSANEKRFNAIYDQVLGHTADPDAIVYRSKLQVMQNALASEVYALTNLLSRIAASNRRARDFTDNILETVIRETIASFPVYRTYIDDRGEYSERDAAFLRSAIARAKRLNPDINASAFDFLRETLLLKSNSPAAKPKPDPDMLYFALKFQQLTGPVMAKGVEDTAFYVYTRFLSSNEVGGSMKSFGVSLDTLHKSNQERLRHSPDTMLTTSTHDTKRSEDVRNRLNVLSELPQLWSKSVRSWQRMNARFKQTLDDGRTAPDNNEEYLLYQTIVGAWPWQMESRQDREEYVERIKQYAAKALAEAKINLSWINPDPDYVKAVHAFITAILMPGGKGKETPFVASLSGLLPKLKLFGAINSLAQVVLKIAVPGVPDFYQGSELWDLSLVDPDNRRPVDYDLRARVLDELHESPAGVCPDLLAHLDDGRIKLWTTHRALALRHREHTLFRRGEYLALEVEGDRGEHVIGFLRQDAASGRSLLAVLPRFACTLMKGKVQLPLGEAWGTDRLRLPVATGTRYRNAFTDEVLVVEEGSLALSSIFASFPVALLLSE